MKKLFIALLTLSLFIGTVFAGNGVSSFSKNRAFNEGTQTSLTPEQIETIRPWAENSMVFLKQAIEDINGQPYVERERLLLHAIKNVVLASAPKNSELLMRYVLNRGLRVHWILGKNQSPDDNIMIDTKVRVLRESIEMAIKYWELDLAYLSQNEDKFKPTNFSKFGFEYAAFLYNINKSVVDATAQYVIMKFMLGLLQWDLYRDSNKRKYAVDITRINDSLKLYPKGLRGNAQMFVSYVRKLKKVYKKLSFVSKVEQKRIAKIKKRRAEAKRLAEERRKALSNELNAGDKVVYLDEYIREIEFLAEDGQVVLKANGTRYRVFTTVGSVSKVIRCFKGYCTGQEVIYLSGIATIEFAAANGTIVLAADRGHRRRFTTIDSLSKVK